MSETAPSYYERRAWNHGTVTERLGKDALSSFDECRLSLTKAVDPVCTRDGIIYSREAILESLLAQKKANRKKQAAYDKFVAEKALKEERGQEHDRDVEALTMLNRQMGASDAAIGRLKNVAKLEYEEAETGKQLVSNVKNIKSEAAKLEGLKSFWISGRERSDGRREAEHWIEKPDTTTRCPATNKPLKLKDLITVRFQKNKDGEYVDPVTRKPLSNGSKLVVLKDLREGANVMTRDTFKRVVEPEGEYNGERIDKDEGVIALVSGGTGFAGTNKDQLQASKHFAVGSTLHRGASASRTGKSSGLQLGN